MVSTFDIETGNFIYRDFDVNFAILHDKKMTNISLAGNKLSLVFDNIDIDKNDYSVADNYEEYKAFKKCTVEYELVDAMGLSCAVLETDLNSHNEYKTKILSLREFVIIAPDLEFDMLNTTISGSGVQLFLMQSAFSRVETTLFLDRKGVKTALYSKNSRLCIKAARTLLSQLARLV